jgi:hypothetical protein
MMWGLHKALVVSHATARVHHAAWRRGGNEHFVTCGACLEAPEVERGNRYSALRMTAKGRSFSEVHAYGREVCFALQDGHRQLD